MNDHDRPAAAGRAFERLLPWGAVGLVVTFVSWLTWPLWHTPGYLFIHGLQHHKVSALWRHDFVARQLAAGELPSLLTDFDWPSPVTRFQSNIPSQLEFIVSAPAAWLLDFPAQWGLAQAFTILLLALSVVWLSRAMGSRGLGLAIAGGMGAAMWPLWHDIAAVRLNAVWVWAAFATVAAGVEVCKASARLEEEPSTRRWLWWGVMTVIIAVAGAQTLMLYPFYAALAAPLGAALILPRFRQQQGRRLSALALTVGLGLGLAMAWGDLSALVAWAPRSRVASCAPNYRCPWPQQVIAGELLFGLAPGKSVLLVEHYGTSLFSWGLAPLALIWRPLRARRALIFAVIVFYGVLSTGPCPTWSPGPLPEGTILDHLPKALVPLYCGLMPLKDWSRLAFVALGFAAALTGLGVEALWRRGSLWRGAAALVGLVAVMHPTWLMRAELGHDANWTHIRMPQSVSWLRSVEPGPMAELPFDPTQQYLSVLGAPVAPRLNPVTVDFIDSWPLSEQPFLRWLQQLGKVELPSKPYPTRAEAEASGLRYVYYHPERCERDPSGAQSLVCTADIPAALAAVLGAPFRLASGASYWDIKPLERDSEGAREMRGAPRHSDVDHE